MRALLAGVQRTLFVCMTSTPLPPPSLSQALAQRLRERLLAHEWAPGTELHDSALAAHYGVSRTPVREAFKLLCYEGLLTAHPRRGVTVAVFTPQERQEAQALEALLLQFAQQHPASQAPESLCQALLRMTTQRLRMASAAPP